MCVGMLFIWVVRVLICKFFTLVRFFGHHLIATIFLEYHGVAYYILFGCKSLTAAKVSETGIINLRRATAEDTKFI